MLFLRVQNPDYPVFCRLVTQRIQSTVEGAMTPNAEFYWCLGTAENFVRPFDEFDEVKNKGGLNRGFLGNRLSESRHDRRHGDQCGDQISPEYGVKLEQDFTGGSNFEGQ